MFRLHQINRHQAADEKYKAKIILHMFKP